jgi:hypothetical protein
LLSLREVALVRLGDANIRRLLSAGIPASTIAAGTASNE